MNPLFIEIFYLTQLHLQKIILKTIIETIIILKKEYANYFLYDDLLIHKIHFHDEALQQILL